MALILCNGCGKSISEDSASCPHCGKQIDPKEEKHYVNEVVPTGIHKKSVQIILALAIGIPLIILACVLTYKISFKGPQGFYTDKRIYFVLEFDGRNATSRFLVGGLPVKGSWTIDDKGNVTIDFEDGTSQVYTYDEETDRLNLFNAMLLEKLEGTEKEEYLVKAEELNQSYRRAYLRQKLLE